MSTRSFVIGDVHGCAHTLHHLLFKVLKIRRPDRVYLLGDLIDRGPRSKEVLDTLMRLRSAGYSIGSVRGNHEEMLLNACRDRDSFRLWMLNGGAQTLASFNVEDACEIPFLYRNFIAGLPYYQELDRFVLVHAGINWDAADPYADHESMLWSRAHSAHGRRPVDRRVICGHTSLPLAEIRNSLATDCITLDGGCVYAQHPALGKLVALELETMALYDASYCD